MMISAVCTDTLSFKYTACQRMPSAAKLQPRPCHRPANLTTHTLLTGRSMCEGRQLVRCYNFAASGHKWITSLEGKLVYSSSFWGWPTVCSSPCVASFLSAGEWYALTNRSAIFRACVHPPTTSMTAVASLRRFCFRLWILG